MSGQFWTDVVTVPATLSDTLVILHQDVTITVNEVYGAESDPLEGVNVYLFTASGSYMGRYLVTNSLGQVTFNLPQKDYKVRADYLSGQFWSDVFVWQNVDVDIAHGIVDVHVTFNGEDVADAPVYLFTATGSYLGRYEYTDSYGHVLFLIPAQSYKFRVDYEGTQYRSDVISVIAHEETDVEMPLEQLALNKTNDPNPVRYDGEPPKFEPERIKVASIGSLAGILSQTVIANTTPPKVYYYLNDHLGTPQLMTDENNVVVWEAKYRPFGEAVVHPYSTVENNVRLPGQYFDQETGFHYNYHRYYDPRTGRYLRGDPSHSYQAEGTGIPYLFPILLTSPQELNLYPYVANNPIYFSDPSGLKMWIIITGGGGGGLGPIAGEGGTYYLVDPYSGQFHQWVYGSFGVGIGFGGAAQLEGGLFDGPCEPTQMSNWSLTVSAFAAAGGGVSGQITGTSFWGEGEAGTSLGAAGGAGAGFSGMITYSHYVGKGNVLPAKYRKLYQKLRMKITND